MKEIREMYAKLMDKGGFKERLAEVLYLTPDTVKGFFKKGGEMKDVYIPVVKKCLIEELENDKKIKEIRVNSFKNL